MADVSILEPLTTDNPVNFSELEASCGRFIDTWLAAGGEPTDDAVVGFYGLWSQSLDVPRNANKAEEEAAFYDWAYPHFIRFRDEVASLLTRAPDEN
jgi:hypothetical protein